MNTVIRIAGITEESIVDGPGIRFVVFAQGCRHHCPGCHNPQTHGLEGGTLITVDEILQRMKQNPLLDGITLSGGDPFEQAESFAELAHRARISGYTVMTYTGYTYEALQQEAAQHPGWHRLLRNTHLLVDGPFRQNEHNPLLRFRGSENQRIVDVHHSLNAGSLQIASF